MARGRPRPFPRACVPELAKVLWGNTAQKCWLPSLSGERPGAPRGPGASGRPARPGSEVLLPPLLSLDGVQDRLPFGLVLLPDLFDLLLHHGVEGQEPLLKVLHCPALQLEEKWKVQSQQGPGQQQKSGEVSLCRHPAGRDREGRVIRPSLGWRWTESDIRSNAWHQAF